jgi:hypothetical protein
MNFSRNRNFWISVAAGCSVAAALFLMRRRSHQLRAALHGYQTRVVHNMSRLTTWRFDHRLRTLSAGNTLRTELESPAVVHWTVNQWDAVEDTHTTEIAPGVHVADLATEGLPPATRVQFTFYWPDVKRWEGEDFELRIEAAAKVGQNGILRADC